VFGVGVVAGLGKVDLSFLDRKKKEKGKRRWVGGEGVSDGTHDCRLLKRSATRKQGSIEKSSPKNEKRCM